VAVVDVNEAGGQRSVESIRALPGEAIFVTADVGLMDDVRETMYKTVDQYGRLHVVYSNAASYTVASATDLSEADWDRTQAVCLKATWILAHCALPTILRTEAGTFLITASVQSIRGYANHAAYQAAKGGLISLTRSTTRPVRASGGISRRLRFPAIPPHKNCGLSTKRAATSCSDSIIDCPRSCRF